MGNKGTNKTLNAKFNNSNVLDLFKLVNISTKTLLCPMNFSKLQTAVRIRTKSIDWVVWFFVVCCFFFFIKSQRLAEHFMTPAEDVQNLTEAN